MHAAIESSGPAAGSLAGGGGSAATDAAKDAACVHSLNLCCAAPQQSLALADASSAALSPPANVPAVSALRRRWGDELLINVPGLFSADGGDFYTGYHTGCDRSGAGANWALISL